jgi:hypothetical protein
MISDGIRRYLFRLVLPAFIVAVLTSGSPFIWDLCASEGRNLCSLSLPLYSDQA